MLLIAGKTAMLTIVEVQTTRNGYSSSISSYLWRLLQNQDSFIGCVGICVGIFLFVCCFVFLCFASQIFVPFRFLVLLVTRRYHRLYVIELEYMSLYLGQMTLNSSPSVDGNKNHWSMAQTVDRRYIYCYLIFLVYFLTFGDR